MSGYIFTASEYAHWKNPKSSADQIVSSDVHHFTHISHITTSCVVFQGISYEVHLDLSTMSLPCKGFVQDSVFPEEV